MPMKRGRRVGEDSRRFEGSNVRTFKRLSRRSLNLRTSEPSNLRTLVVGALLLCIAVAANAADPFHQRLMRQGTDAYNRRDFGTAVRQLRLACFGFLDEPDLLAEGLTRLAVAQAGNGDGAGFSSASFLKGFFESLT